MRLVYYNPNVAVHTSVHHMPGMRTFSNFFKIFNPTVMFVDRTNTISIPVSVKSLFPMPKFREMKKSFEALCDERATELLQRAEKLGVKLNVLYSGGIDSTLMLVSLIKNADRGQKDNIVVLLTEDSILENPNFYSEHIRGKLATDSSESFPYLLGTKNLIVGGEHNDQLFGSDMVGRLILRFGPGVINAPYDRGMFKTVFTEACGDERGVERFLDLFEKLASVAPVPIQSNFDHLWWINFSLKWQSVFMRMLCYTTARNVKNIDDEYIRTYYNHFYSTEEFQLWSMNNQDKKIKDSWSTYKWPCKEIIYDYTKDAEYRDTKVKRGSLHGLLLQQDSFDFIDERMHFHRSLEPAEYHNSTNDFV